MTSKVKIGLITTLKTNIGDDLIREGICLVLRDLFHDRQIEFIPINKHEAMTVYPNWHPVHWTKVLPSNKRLRYPVSNLLGKATYNLGFSHFDSCDYIVQCGAPVLWENCHQSEWADLLWHQVVKRLHKKVPVLNLAAGSCYPWERQPTQLTNTKDANYLSTIASYCQLTTVRDSLAHNLLANLGISSSLIPCSAFLAADNLVGNTEDRSPILINYMKGAGHFDWAQGIDTDHWQVTMQQLITCLKAQHNVAFLCHDAKEYELAQQLDPTIPRLWPQTPHEYFEAIKNAKLGICNRMHAAVAISSLGIPAIAVCTDSRLLMLKEIGVHHAYVKDANLAYLQPSIEYLLNNRKQEQERLLCLRQATRKRYGEAIMQTINSKG